MIEAHGEGVRIMTLMGILLIIVIIFVLACIIIMCINMKKKSDCQSKMVRRNQNDKNTQGDVNNTQEVCVSCGNIQVAGNKFCVRCGRKMGVDQPGEKYCPNCGVKVMEGMLFCGECGTRLT